MNVAFYLAREVSEISGLGLMSVRLAAWKGELTTACRDRSGRRLFALADVRAWLAARDDQAARRIAGARRQATALNSIRWGHPAETVDQADTPPNPAGRKSVAGPPAGPFGWPRNRPGGGHSS